jgi:cytochrome bd-type quinol oxidase subunit 2
MNSMRLSLKPTTTIGKWSTGLIIAFFLFFLVFLILVASGQRGDDTFFSFTALTIPGLLAGVSAVSAMVTGVISIVKSRERSVLVFLATAIGFLLLILLLGEILVPH